MFECIKCGKCCTVGYEVRIKKEDVEKWIRGGHDNILRYIQLDPKCVSSESLFKFNIDEETVLEKLRKKLSDREFDKQKIELINFIIKNHWYMGTSLIPLRIPTILHKRKKSPIYEPKSFQVMLEGLKWDLIYITQRDPLGGCPFLRWNQCTIHDIKPKVCTLFPYDENGNLRKQKLFLSFCKGFKSL